ncbi:MAG: DUF5597 domain-containing protein [Prolixibacteraceae bacterium]|jgi:hypothetical protein|nr:DUF5597 domain-containing protein [Prolixibacteraceae bacterium]
MKFYLKLWIVIMITTTMLPDFLHAQAVPHLQKNGNAQQLIVDGKPYLILGGELHNSSSSNVEYLQPAWNQLKEMNLNTVLTALSWQLIEPEEGNFDFSLVDALLEDAREHDFKLIFLWFGSWKNGLSHYTPSWVKEDQDRFARVRLNSGKATETLSPLSMEARKADAKAFAALMAHLKKVDSKERTVIMMQAQNEVGVIGAARDHSQIANAAFNKQVPTDLIKGLKELKNELQPEMIEYWSKTKYKETGTWPEIFGENHYADEAFMAWNYARYINEVVAAGKAEYNIPMFVNAWIVQPEDTKPGDYPAGGPQSRVHDIWRVGAPDIDLQCPDIYLDNFPEIVNMYHHSWNPLFIPESFSGFEGAANTFYAIGKHAALGYSPFGIDDPVENPSESPLAKAYNVLDQLTPVITEAQAKGTISAFWLTTANNPQTVELGGYTIEASLPKNWRTGETTAEKGYGLVIWKGGDEFILAGSDLNVVFLPKSEGKKMAGFDTIYEGEYIDGKWKPGRLLNGDNIMINYNLSEQAAINRTGTAAKLETEPSVLQVKLYRFE